MAVIEILPKALELLKPSLDERVRIESSLNEFLEKLRNCIKNLNLNLDVEIEGSIAKDTWLSKEQDIDVFVLFPKRFNKDDFKNIILSLTKCVVGDNFVEAYAEHPYVELYYNGLKIDLVPCFKLSSVNEAKSSVDRTPFHTMYIKSNLTDNLKDEIRLLKGFMKGIGCYGAEIKVRGFSGYLCELLVLHYGSFINVVRNAIEWKPYNTFIDIEGYYNDIGEAIKLFNAPLIVIDPVDKNRNVAAALSIESMSKFILASRIFMESPNLEFFFPKPVEPLSKDKLTEEIKTRGSDLIFIITECPKVHSEILWGQLHKSVDGLKNLISNSGFKVINYDVWSNEENLAIFIFELESAKLPKIKRHVGPPIFIKSEVKKFLNKYVHSPTIFSGPKIEGSNCVVYVKRKYTDVKQLLLEQIFSAKLGSLIRSSLKNKCIILQNEEIIDLYSSNLDFSIFLTNFLKTFYPWLIKIDM
ncbi:MAG: CCA tRNA nucleotidyltransferase [Candidatus Methanomethylicia archaeon]|nr:CCA tRNA nucleotidyltransferase [Candidatus Methanomethylicia archaeon]MCX8169008.1 CCA tRNA nucleotidyltransferase [Candidatus Methanomethylicia archaeon]MDW7988740.1 CCA tRNA nucleotidyltransferase [Nitrososphaerota archaeon]